MKVTDLFYEDISANLYEKDVEEVIRVIELAVKYGMFDERLFGDCRVLTSLDIQRQYLYCIRRRKLPVLNHDFWLVPADEMPDKEGVNKDLARRNAARSKKAVVTEAGGADTDLSKNVTAHRQIKESKANEIKQTKENTPPSIPPGEEQLLEEDNFMKPMVVNVEEVQSKSIVRKVWTQEEIESLMPPKDGVERNYDGLLMSLSQYRIPPTEQSAIISISNYGRIGSPVWMGLSEIRKQIGRASCRERVYVLV